MTRPTPSEAEIERAAAKLTEAQKDALLHGTVSLGMVFWMWRKRFLHLLFRSGLTPRGEAVRAHLQGEG
jgi:hypothetical protein